MQTMGERMEEQEIDEILGDSELVNNDYIHIEEFAKMFWLFGILMEQKCILE